MMLSRFQRLLVETRTRLWWPGATAPDLYNCDEALFAPQAELIGVFVQGAFGGDINLPMVLLGAIIAVVLIRLAMPVMSVAIGIYLPCTFSSNNGWWNNFTRSPIQR